MESVRIREGILTQKKSRSSDMHCHCQQRSFSLPQHPSPLLSHSLPLSLFHSLPQNQVFYVPAWGLAPKWCSFLDQLTEELEETATPSAYDDFKFITKEEIEMLGLQKLVGE